MPTTSEPTSEPVAPPAAQPAVAPADVDLEAEDPWASWADEEPVDEAALAAEQARLRARLVRHDVTAVLVAHDGARWLRFCLAALADLDRPPRRVVAVDTGSTDGSHELLAESLGAASVLTMPRDTGYGAAVAHAVEALTGAPGLPSPGPDTPVVEWLWLLHDDCAPEPDALRQLLLEVERTPSAAIVGPKVRGWKDGRLLLELGVTVGRGGRRETYLERGETDQGQHDNRHDVLAVGSAGMLVRRDAWEALGGFAEDLPLFRDDVDLGWRARRAGYRVVVAPDAVVHHAEAAAHGRRSTDAAGGDVHRADRRSALMLLLANLPAWSLPWAYVRLTIGSLLRGVALLIGKAPVEAAEELGAWTSVILRPDRVRAARRRRAQPVTEAWPSVRAYLAPSGTHLRHGLEAFVGVAGARAGTPGAGSAIESGPVDESTEALGSGSDGALARLARRPGTLLTLGLLAITLLAWRALLVGGPLQGGALLPAPSGAADLWQRYTEAWHDVGVGSAADAPPWIAALATSSIVTLGRPGLVVSLLFLLAVPLAGVSAYLALRRVTGSLVLRVWGSTTYALLPVVTGAVAAGRIGTTALAWLLPWMVLSGAHLLSGPLPSWRRIAGTGLLLALGTAFVPLVWVAAALALVGIGAVTRAARAWWLRILVLLLVPVGVLLPWSLGFLVHPTRLLLEAGATDSGLADAALPPWALLLAWPGGPGQPARWAMVGLLVVALAAVAVGRRRRGVAAAWAAVALGLLLGFAAVLVRVDVPAVGSQVTPWPGLATLLVGGGLVVAAVLGAGGARGTLAQRTFGWRHPLTAILVVLGLLTPVVAAVSLVDRGAGGPLARRSDDVLPAFVAAAAATPQRPSTLVLSSAPGTPVAYSLQHESGPRLGDADVAPAAGAAGPLDDLVRQLASGSAGDDAVGRLATYGAAYVLVLAPADPALTRAIDSVPGLERLSATDGSALWGVAGAPSFLRVQVADGTALALSSAPAGEDTTTPVPAPAPGSSGARVLALAAAVDPRWAAILDGQPLAALPADRPPAVDPPAPAYAGPSATWAQRFELGPASGILDLRYDGTSRTRWLLLEVGLLAAVVVVALPGRRRELVEDDDEPEALALPAEPLRREGSS